MGLVKFLISLIAVFLVFKFSLKFIDWTNLIGVLLLGLVIYAVWKSGKK